MNGSHLHAPTRIHRIFLLRGLSMYLSYLVSCVSFTSSTPTRRRGQSQPLHLEWPCNWLLEATCGKATRRALSRPFYTRSGTQRFHMSYNAGKTRQARIQWSSPLFFSSILPPSMVNHSSHLDLAKMHLPSDT